jgi:hypothetical protein
LAAARLRLALGVTTTMLRNLRPALTTWPFLVSLVALLLNDAWLKGAFPGFVTGKLSDFAGVAVVGLLLLALNPAHPIRTMTGVAVAFAWWKSPLSQSAIDVFNAYSAVQIGRVVDYTDLVAVGVLPAIARVARQPMAFQIPGNALRRVLVVPVAALTMLGLMATSVIPTRQDYQVRQPDVGTPLNRDAIAKTLARVAEKHGLKCQDCAETSSRARYVGDGMTFEYRFVDANLLAFGVDAIPNGLFFGLSGTEKADRLRASLKIELASLHKGLEYVERLDGHRGAR